LVESDFDGCVCPEAWSENSNPDKPDNMKKYEDALRKKAQEDESKANDAWKKRHPKK
jgi:hypothetical protein